MELLCWCVVCGLAGEARYKLKHSIKMSVRREKKRLAEAARQSQIQSAMADVHHRDENAVNFEPPMGLADYQRDWPLSESHVTQWFEEMSLEQIIEELSAVNPDRAAVVKRRLRKTEARLALLQAKLEQLTTENTLCSSWDAASAAHKAHVEKCEADGQPLQSCCIVTPGLCISQDADIAAEAKSFAKFAVGYVRSLSKDVRYRQFLSYREPTGTCLFAWQAGGTLLAGAEIVVFMPLQEKGGKATHEEYDGIKFVEQAVLPGESWDFEVQTRVFPRLKVVLPRMLSQYGVGKGLAKISPLMNWEVFNHADWRIQEHGLYRVLDVSKGDFVTKVVPDDPVVPVGPIPKAKAKAAPKAAPGRLTPEQLSAAFANMVEKTKAVIQATKLKLKDAGVELKAAKKRCRNGEVLYSDCSDDSELSDDSGSDDSVGVDSSDGENVWKNEVKKQKCKGVAMALPVPPKPKNKWDWIPCPHYSSKDGSKWGRIRISKNSKGHFDLRAKCHCGAEFNRTLFPNDLSGQGRPAGKVGAFIMVACGGNEDYHHKCVRVLKELEPLAARISGRARHFCNLAQAVPT